MSLLPALLLACQSGSTPFDGAPRERPAGFADPELGTTGASPVLQLWKAPGRYQLPPSTLPAGFEVRDTFEVELEPRATKKKRSSSVYKGPSPFPESLDEEARMAAPPGVRLFVGDQELRYDPGLTGKSWKINGDKLLVAWPGLEVPRPTITNHGVSATLHRRDFATSGLAPEVFVRDQVTLSDRTREGLLLPAPGKAEWDVTLPAGARFRAHLAMEPLPLAVLRSDGAQVVLSIVEGGATQEVARRRVSGRTDDFGSWEVDLSDWAGRAVTLVLSTEPGATADFDHVFLGAPTVWGAPTGPVRHVVVVGLDTTRPDHFGSYGYGRDTTPELDLVAGSSMVFERLWTPAPRTRPSFRSAFTGRRPLDAVGARNIAEVFSDHGFATAGVVANVHLQPRFDFNEGFDDWWYDSGAKAGEQVDRALDWLAENQDRDTFQFVHIMDPHIFYNAPPSYRNLFVEDPDPKLPEVFNRWEVYDWIEAGRVDDRRKKHIEALYDAELRYTSHELGRLFDQLDRVSGHTLVVLHSDHGEELFDHGRFEHNHTLYEETTRGLLWFRSGGGQQAGQRLDVPVTLADIGPTLFDFAGFEDAPPTDGRSLRGLLLGTEDGSGFADREIPIGHLRYGYEKWGVTVGNKKYILATMTGDEELYDLTTDPDEQKSLATQVPLDGFREALARSHGMQVGRGWRIQLNVGAARETFTFRLPEPAVAAEIMDPEATIETPANEEWGERPARTREDVGTLTLSEDRLALTWVPGPKPAPGYLTVLFGHDVNPEPLVIERDAVPLVTMVSRGRVSWRAGGDTLSVIPGTVVIPPIDEATRMRLLHGEGGESTEDRALLCQLGYVECDTPAAESHGD